MAGDWIKFEIATSDKPEVWEIADKLNLDPDAVVGKLLRVWGWFDQQTEKGNAPIVTKMLLDRIVGVTGFCDSVISAGWMLQDDKAISLPNFERHNGKTAKNRAVTAKRVAEHKKKQKSNDEGNGASVTTSVNCALPKEEKRREDISNTDTNVSVVNEGVDQSREAEQIGILGDHLPDQPKIKPCPHNEIISLYHDMLPELQRVQPKLWPQSQSAKHLQARWKQAPEHQSLEFWTWFFAGIKKIPWYLGQNDRGWRANLHWLVKRENFIKAIERITSN